VHDVAELSAERQELNLGWIDGEVHYISSMLRGSVLREAVAQHEVSGETIRRVTFVQAMNSMAER
jgi:hypothetical protein